jgi:hypothetical protein
MINECQDTRLAVSGDLTPAGVRHGLNPSLRRCVQKMR